VVPHPGCNAIIAVIERRPRRRFDGIESLEIPCEYQIVCEHGDMQLLPSPYSEFEEVREMVVRLPSRHERPCQDVEEYPEVESGYDSPNEILLAVRKRVCDVMWTAS
jgi:hypothetical protein